MCLCEYADALDLDGLTLETWLPLTEMIMYPHCESWIAWNLYLNMIFLEYTLLLREDEQGCGILFSNLIRSTAEAAAVSLCALTTS